MEDAPSCFQWLLNIIGRLRTHIRNFIRIITFRQRPNELPQANAASRVIQVSEPMQMLRIIPHAPPRVEVGVDVSDPLRLQIVAPSDQQAPPQAPPPAPPPPPPPLPFEPQRRRRPSRPAPTYDLATLTEIKDALDTLEMVEHVENMPSTDNILHDSTIITIYNTSRTKLTAKEENENKKEKEESL